jgi:hypothetical protein
MGEGDDLLPAPANAAMNGPAHQPESAPGLKVIAGGVLAEAGQTPASDALQAAKGVAGLALELGWRWLNRSDQAEPRPLSPAAQNCRPTSVRRPSLFGDLKALPRSWRIAPIRAIPAVWPEG